MVNDECRASVVKIRNYFLRLIQVLVRAIAKLFFKEYLLVVQLQQALTAKAVFIFFCDERFGSNGKLYTMALAIANISGLAFKRTFAAGACFGLVFTIIIFHFIKMVEEMLLSNPVVQ